VKVSDEGLHFISLWEGCSLKRYADAAGYWTIGVGHLITDSDPQEAWKHKGIDAEKALQLLKIDIEHAESSINRYVTWPLKQTQHDALTSWCFNVGGYNVKVSTLVKLLNSSEEGKVGRELVRWNKAGGKILPGLTRRRKAEAKLFNLGDYGKGP